MGLKISIKVNENTYGKQTLQRVKQSQVQAVKDAIEESPELRREIARTFQMANRRIQNLQSHDDLISPALASLGDRADIEGYSKFRIGQFGHTSEDWQALKREYAEAIAFLQQPTSMVNGARELEAHIKDAVLSNGDIKEPEKLWDGIKESIINGFNAVTSEMLAAMPYRDLMQQIYTNAVKDASSQMESDAKSEADRIQEEIDRQALEIVEETHDTIQSFIRSMNSFPIL